EEGMRDWSVTGVQRCALPISARHHEAAGEDPRLEGRARADPASEALGSRLMSLAPERVEHELRERFPGVPFERQVGEAVRDPSLDRKGTRLNSRHWPISYALL